MRILSAAVVCSCCYCIVLIIDLVIAAAVVVVVVSVVAVVLLLQFVLGYTCRFQRALSPSPDIQNATAEHTGLASDVRPPSSTSPT